MSKILLFLLLTYVFGNPFIGLIVLLILLYFLDRQFVGVFPSITKPLKNARQRSALAKEIALNPHHARNRLDLGILWIEKGKYAKALPYLETAAQRLDDMAEAHYYYGLALLQTGEEELGLASIEKALALNPRVVYGEPYLVLAQHYRSKGEANQAKAALQSFHGINSSSSEAYYRLGEIHREAGEKDSARRAYEEAIENYRLSPKFIRKKERRWAVLAWFRKLTL